HDARTFRRHDRRAHQLEEAVRSVARIDERQLAARELAALARVARERRGEEPVVQRDGATTTFALLFFPSEVELGARVRDDEAPFGIREEDRIGNGLEDALEERALAIEASLRAREHADLPEVTELPPEHAEQPARFGARGAAEDDEADGLA